MARPSALTLAPPLIFAVLALGFYLGVQRGNHEELPSTLIGKQAPAVTTETLPGYPGVPDEDLTAGELTLVNFWASWCPPCRAEHPQLTQFAAEGIRIVGVNFNDRADAALAYLEDEGNPFAAIAYDPQGRTAFDWGIAAPPETFIVAPDGTVLYKFIGALVGSDLEQRFMPELRKAQAALNAAASAETGQR